MMLELGNFNIMFCEQSPEESVWLGIGGFTHELVSRGRHIDKGWYLHLYIYKYILSLNYSRLIKT